MKTHSIKIIERISEKVVTEMRASSQWEAERIKSGASINLNHADFKIEISEIQQELS